MNGTIMRVVQCAAWLGCALAFDITARADPEGLTRQAWLLGVLICGFGGMFAITWLTVLVLYGRRAARTIEWY